MTARNPMANLNLVAAVTETCRENEVLAARVEQIEELYDRTLKELAAAKAAAENLERERDAAREAAGAAAEQRDEYAAMLREAMTRSGGRKQRGRSSPSASRMS